jgi:hypothetical protein
MPVVVPESKTGFQSKMYGQKLLISNPIKNISELNPFKSLKVKYLSELNTAVVTAVELP